MAPDTCIVLDRCICSKACVCAAVLLASLPLARAPSCNAHPSSACRFSVLAAPRGPSLPSGQKQVSNDLLFCLASQAAKTSIARVPFVRDVTRKSPDENAVEMQSVSDICHSTSCPLSCSACLPTFALLACLPVRSLSSG